MPVAAWRPRCVRFAVPPAVAIIARTATLKAVYSEICTAAAVHPQTLPVHSPGSPCNASCVADLAIQRNLVWVVVATIVAAAIVRFAFQRILRLNRRNCHQYE